MKIGTYIENKKGEKAFKNNTVKFSLKNVTEVKKVFVGVIHRKILVSDSL